jgi:hypothetical protein
MFRINQKDPEFTVDIGSHIAEGIHALFFSQARMKSFQNRTLETLTKTFPIFSKKFRFLSPEEDDAGRRWADWAVGAPDGNGGNSGQSRIRLDTWFFQLLTDLIEQIREDQIFWSDFFSYTHGASVQLKPILKSILEVYQREGKEKKLQAEVSYLTKTIWTIVQICHSQFSKISTFYFIGGLVQAE